MILTGNSLDILPTVTVTEKMVQDALYCRLREGFACIFPNVDTITGYEADILAITKAGYAYEYEIKLSLADFRADMKKQCKHASISGAVKKIPNPYAWDKEREIYVLAAAPDDPYQAVRNGICYPEQRPKKFWYVVHGFNVPAGELPAYAGLMQFINARHGFQVLTLAPNLPAKKAAPQRLARARENMLFRYWSLRLKDELF